MGWLIGSEYRVDSEEHYPSSEPYIPPSPEQLTEEARVESLRLKNVETLKSILSSYNVDSEILISKCRTLLGDENYSNMGYPDVEARKQIADEFSLSAKDLEMVMSYIATHC